MTVRFPDEPGFQGRFAPVRLEGEIRGVEVTQGEIPSSLRGTTDACAENRHML